MAEWFAEYITDDINTFADEITEKVQTLLCPFVKLVIETSRRHKDLLINMSKKAREAQIKARKNY